MPPGPAGGPPAATGTWRATCAGGDSSPPPASSCASTAAAAWRGRAGGSGRAVSGDGTGTGTGESRDRGRAGIWGRPPPTESPIPPAAGAAAEAGAAGAGRRRLRSATGPLHAQRGESCGALSSGEISAIVPSPLGAAERRVPTVPAGRSTPLLELPSPPSLHCGSHERGRHCPGTRRCFPSGSGVLGVLCPISSCQFTMPPALPSPWTGGI